MTAPPPPDLAAFCAAEFPRLVRMLDLLTGDVHVAEELAQDALVRAASQWDRVRTMDRPDAWVRRVARNLATSAWRRRQAAGRAAARVGPDAVIHHDVDLTEVDEVRRALQRLSVRDREVLVLRHHLGLSIGEVAAELGLSVSATKSRASRAAARLRDRLGPPSESREATDAR